jgi:hypothetical protein
MVETLAMPNAPHFTVLIGQYYLDGAPYFAAAVSLSPASENLRQTQAGFAFDAHFPPDMLNSREREGKEVSANGLIQVELEVRLEDVAAVMQHEPIPPGGTLFVSDSGE